MNNAICDLKVMTQYAITIGLHVSLQLILTTGNLPCRLADLFMLCDAGCKHTGPKRFRVKHLREQLRTLLNQCSAHGCSQRNACVKFTDMMHQDITLRCCHRGRKHHKCCRWQTLQAW